MPDDPDLDPITHDYGEGKSPSQEAIDSAMMLGIVLLATVIALGLGLGALLVWWAW